MKAAALILVSRVEDTKGVLIIRVCKLKERQHNDYKKRDTKTNNDLQTLHIKQKIE